MFLIEIFSLFLNLILKEFNINILLKSNSNLKKKLNIDFLFSYTINKIFMNILYCRIIVKQNS